MGCINKKINRWCIFSGVFVLIIGFLISGFWKHFYDKLLFSKLNLDNGSESLAAWRETAVPLYVGFYLFNWTNPEQSLNKRERPKFVQLGPYVFREHHSKKNITWNLNDTMTYDDIHSWYFMKNMSNGPLTDNVTTINMMAVTVLTRFKYLKAWEKMVIIDPFVKVIEKSLFVTKTVGELLFDGYNDKLIDFIKRFKKILNIDLPYDKFGWYYGKNMTSTGVFNMFDGIKNINRLGELHTWNNRTHCEVYKGDCDHVHGTVGEVWPLDSSLRQKAAIFIPDLCSTFVLTNNGSKVVYGLDGTTFIGLADIFDNGTKTNDTRCYCPDYTCQFASGVRNVSSCLHGSPTFISFPHFYLADDSYIRNIEGVHPDAEKHTFRVTLEKNTGIIIEASARLQINVFLQPIKDMKMIENVPEVFVPVLWFEQYMNMPNNVTHKITFLAVTIPNLLTAVGFIIICFAAILLLLCLSA